MELDWTVEREGETSLVGFRLRNDGGVARRVRIESRLQAPVLPPRRGGVPEPGWDATGVTAVLDPGERAAFGFAALAEPVEPPVEVASVEPAASDPDGGHAAAEEDDLALAAVRDLESHRPPRRAVAEGEPADPDVGGCGDAGAAEEKGDAVARPADETDDPEGEKRAHESAPDRSERDGATPTAVTGDEVDAWFAAVEARIERAERLTDADLAGATAAVEEAGGLGAVEGLDARVAADAERLKAVRDRAAALAERAEASAVPTEALEALA